MWPFSKQWNAPAPHSAFVISLANRELPSLVSLANPDGIDGAVQGMAGPADGKPTAENMIGPMREGQYVAISPTGGGCRMRVERAEPQAEGLSFGPEVREASGLTEEMLARFNHPVWRVILEMEEPGKEVKDTVIFATRLAQRLAALGDGVVMDGPACRFFGPAGWPVDEPMPEFDVREHVHIHFVPDLGWYHTHGLIKFGRPEMEIYDVPTELDLAAFTVLLDISQYIVTSGALIEPGQTCGDPKQPFYAREGTKNKEDHWEEVSVLELVDLDERTRPVASGAPKALRFTASSEYGTEASEPSSR
jgi:hypothetical protein